MINVSNFQIYASYHVNIAQTILSCLQTGTNSIENNVDKIFEYLQIMTNHQATYAVIPSVALRKLLLRIEDQMHVNPRLQLTYDPKTKEIWKYYSVIKVVPIVMDKLRVILLTIPVLDKTLKLNIYQVHNLYCNSTRSEGGSSLSIGEQIFCYGINMVCTSPYLQNNQLGLVCK